MANIKWIRVGKWAEEVGTTKKAFEHYISEGKVIEGRHYIKCAISGAIMVNAEAMDILSEQGSQAA